MNRRTLALRQLVILVSIHFIVDMFTGLLPGFLPRLTEKHSLSIVAATFLLTLCALSANGLQIWIGTLRKNATKPLLIQIGLILGCAICFIGLVPVMPGNMLIMTLLVLVLGFGGALPHPEALRCVCAIDNRSVPATVATSLFMLAGFLGYASGPLVSGTLLECFDFKGLYLVAIPVIILLAILPLGRFHLAPDQPKSTPRSDANLPHSSLTFWNIFAIATLINSGCASIQSLLPTYLHVYDFSLRFGGLSAMLVGVGAGIGALGTSLLTKRFNPAKCIQLEILIGAPLLIIYLFTAPYRSAIVLTPVFGALVGAGFPQLVVLARTASGGPSLGARMGMLVGGSWGIAGVVILAIGWIAKLFSLRLALLTSPLLFLCVPLLIQIMLFKNRHLTKPN